MRWGIKRDQQRRAARRSSSTPRVEQAKVLGVTLPDPELKWNEEREHYDFGAIDWERVLARRRRRRAVQPRAPRPRASRPGTTAPGCAKPRWRTPRKQRERAEGRMTAMSPTTSNEWPLWEVFVRSKAGLDHKHCGSLHAADPQDGDPARARRLHAAPGRHQRVGGALRPDRRERPGRQGHVLRSDGRQGLPPPDLLRAARSRVDHM